MTGQLDMFSSNKATATTPRERILRACAWIADGYPHRWMQLVRICEQEVERGSKCLRRGDLFLIAQHQGMSMSVAKEYRFDNNIWAPVSRYLLMFRPVLAQAIHPNACDLDTYDLKRFWHENVRPGTYFLADTWQDAVAAYESGDASLVTGKRF